MLRDRLTFAMAVGVPVLQLVLFGYAINTDPKGLPTALVSADTSEVAIVMPADGPSFGMAPSGTCTWMSIFEWKSSARFSSAAFERT